MDATARLQRMRDLQAKRQAEARQAAKQDSRLTTADLDKQGNVRIKTERYRKCKYCGCTFDPIAGEKHCRACAWDRTTPKRGVEKPLKYQHYRNWQRLFLVLDVWGGDDPVFTAKRAAGLWQCTCKLARERLLRMLAHRMVREQKPHHFVLRKPEEWFTDETE